MRSLPPAVSSLLLIVGASGAARAQDSGGADDAARAPGRSIGEPSQQDAEDATVLDVEDLESGRVLQLTLEDALRIALQSNIDLELESLATEVSRFDAYGSWGAFDPLLGATGTWSEEERQGSSELRPDATQDSLGFSTSLNMPLTTGGLLDLSLDHTNSTSDDPFVVGAGLDVSTIDVVSVALTQPLLRGAWKRYATSNQREAEIAFERQKEREKEVRATVLLDVVNTYWDLVNATEELVVRELSVQRAEEQVRQDERRLEVGTGTEVDLLQSKTNLAQQKEQRINAIFVLKQARDNLRRRLFQRPEGDLDTFLEEWVTPIEPLTGLPPLRDMKISWVSSLEHAIELRPELWQRRLDIDTAEVRLQRARSERLPQLDLSLSSTAVGVDADPSEAFSTAIGWEFPRHEAGLTFSVPIRNRAAKYAARAARAALRQAQITYDRQELDILAEVRAAVRDVEYRHESVKAAKLSADLAQRQLEAEEARQNIGLSTTFQVLEFQRDLAEARSTEVAARAAYAKALAQLRFSEGRLGTTPVDELAASGGGR